MCQQQSPHYNVSPKVAEEYVGLLASCMIAMENLAGGRLLDAQTLEEDYQQLDREDIEDIELQVGLATMLRRGKDFMDRTGRKTLSKSGLDNSSTTCYNCGVKGHFAN